MIEVWRCPNGEERSPHHTMGETVMPKHTLSRRIGAAAVALGLVLGGAACSDDDDDNGVDLGEEIDEGTEELDEGVDELDQELDEGVDELDEELDGGDEGG
jgi:hypothetical protein